MPSSTEGSNIRNQSLQRAEFAYNKVKSIASSTLSKKDKEKFKSHIKDVPMMIRTNGLAAAYAFVFSKAKRAPAGANEQQRSNEKKDYIAIEDISGEWLQQQNALQPIGGVSDFYEQLIKQDITHYRRATREILALFSWLKRYADGMIN